MKSRNWYPVFEEKRDEMNVRPFAYKKTKARAIHLFESWKDRRFDQKYAAMVAQKREPNLYACQRWFRHIGTTWNGGDAN